MASSQKFIARNRAPRVQIEYDVEVYGAQKKVDLPFVMGVMSDLSGKSAEPLPSVADRKFLEIDVDSFDDRMKAMRPRVAFTVPNTVTGEGNLSVDLTFESMEDFTPGAIASRVDGLRQLLQARTDLSNLMVYMDGKTGAEGLIEQVLGSRSTLAALASGALAPTPPDQTAAALEALRAAAPLPVDTPDPAAGALAALRAAAPAVTARPDTAADALASLRAAAPVAEAADDNAAVALAALRAAAPPEAVVDTAAADALAALRQSAPAAPTLDDTAAVALQALRSATPILQETQDTAGAALAALRAAAPTAEDDPPDSTTDALDALRAVAPAVVETPDAAAETLAALRAAAPVAQAEADTTDVLDALRAVTPMPVGHAQDPAAKALASLRAGAPAVEAATRDTSSDALDALRAVAPIPTEDAQDQATEALSALRAVAPVSGAGAPDTTSDTLNALRAVAPIAAEDTQDPAENALSALRAAALTAEDDPPDTTTDALDALRAATPIPTADARDQATEALSALRAAAPTAEDDPSDTTTDALDALRAVAPLVEETAGAAAEALAALRAVAPVAQAETLDTTTDALDALRAVAPGVETVVSSNAADALAVLREVVPAAVADASDPAAAALAALRSSGAETVAAPDDALAALDSLRSVAPVESLQADDALLILSALRTANEDSETSIAGADADLNALLVPQNEPAEPTPDDPLAGLDGVLTTAPDGPTVPTDEDTWLEDLPPVPPATATNAAVEDPLDGLDNLLAVQPEPAVLVAAAPPVETPDTAPPGDDPLADLMDMQAAPPETDPLAGLDALLAPPVEDDPLAGVVDNDPLAGLLDTPTAPADADPLAGIDDLLSAPAEADPLAGLDDLPAPPAGDDPLAGLQDLPDTPEADPLAGLDDLLSAPAGDDPLDGLQDLLDTPPEDDPLAGLDDLLAVPADDDPLAALLGETAPAAAADAGPDPVDEALAALGALLVPPEPAAEAPAYDPLAELEALLASDGPAPDTAPMDDPLAGLEDLLTAPAGAIAAAPARKEMTMTANSRPMGYGTLTAPDPAPGSLDRPVFRLAILGDFSGRSANGKAEIGDRLAKRRAIRLDIDSVEDVIEGFATTLVLPIGQDGQGIEVELGGLDDLHPDELVDKVELFGELKGLRRRLTNPSTAARAVSELQGWGKDFTAAALPTRNKSSAGSVPADRRLSDFQSLIGDAQGRLTQPSAAGDLIARIVGPHVVPGPNPEAKAMLATVDEAMSAAMRLVLHHPEFQAIEAAWRTLDMVARQIETDEKLEITIFDISAEEFAADVGANVDLARTGVFQLLNEPLTGEGGIGFSAIFGLSTFEETPPHAELLGRMGRIAAHVRAPFVASISAAFMDVAKRDRHPLVSQAWDGLRGDPVAAWLALASPRFLLRRPFGKRTDPIDSFAFEEFTMSEGLSGMLWANPAALVAILLAKTWTQGKGKAMDLGSIMSISDMPYHVVNDAHGDQIALPCTERNVTTEKTEAIVTRGLMPVISIKGRDVVRLGSFQSLAGQQLSGRWGEMPAVAAAPAGRAATMEVPIAPQSAAAIEADLDALLAGFGDTPAPSDPAAIDADLAALLEGL